MRHTDTEHREQRGTRIGYTRVSTVSQTLDQQNEALTAANVTKTFSDIMSGARDDRPGLAALMEYVRTGDTGESPILSPPGFRVGVVVLRLQ